MSATIGIAIFTVVAFIAGALVASYILRKLFDSDLSIGIILAVYFAYCGAFAMAFIGVVSLTDCMV